MIETFVPACREVLVQWITRDMGEPTVQWGLRPGNYSQEEVGTYSTYGRSDMCGAPANTTGYLFPGIMNNALMAGLPPSTRIWYRVGDPVSPNYPSSPLLMARCS